MANKKETNKSNESTIEIKGAIKLIIGILIIAAVLYLMTYLLDKKGKFSEKYIVSDATEAVFTYEDALVGTVFNRKEKEYYVVFEDFGNENKTAISTIINKYSEKDKHKNIYKVDMSLKENQVYKSDYGNKNATSISNLKIKTPTLILINDKSIVKYIEGIDSIKSELK